ncbi:SDR family NAD(P)-dependent oxidoreductase [Actinacidiphila acididurans]|uniref:SDR family NAD(P)-dependent oxidoreductase n=1 Tax=Actinacidiphila acididurans TaxID=2784346 RepID=A0ABS2U1K8_9ACTN|nr:SDR family NAD(P)-dependent oxidoreductase [Actinacidiphila acididurans]MBM9508927.1 SDR family NAD(P)-dependent oxidoreductase [Actinacidiphila acididurans]
MNFSIALVTGASSGIGKEIARQLVQRGLTVYVGSRSGARAEEAAAEIGGGARPLLLDVTDAESVAAAAERIDALDALDILVNNAGISSNEPRLAQDEDVADFRRIYGTNVFGPVAVTNALLPALRRSANPRIVNISSGTASLAWAADQMAAYRGAFASYRSSKAALNALTVMYAQSLAEDGIKVNALAPGLRRTALNAAAAAGGGDPGEAAEAAVRLALLPDDGPSGTFVNWDGTPVPW